MKAGERRGFAPERDYQDIREWPVTYLSRPPGFAYPVFFRCGRAASCMHELRLQPVWCECMAAGERQQRALW